MCSKQKKEALKEILGRDMNPALVIILYPALTMGYIKSPGFSPDLYRTEIGWLNRKPILHSTK